MNGRDKVQLTSPRNFEGLLNELTQKIEGFNLWEEKIVKNTLLLPFKYYKFFRSPKS